MHNFTVVLLFVFVVSTWGTTWLAMRITVEAIPPVFAVGMGFMFAAPFLMGIAVALKSLYYSHPGSTYSSWLSVYFILQYLSP